MRSGFAFLCDGTGVVLRVLYNSLKEHQNLPRFHTIIVEENRAKIADFFKILLTDGIVADRLFYVRANKQKVLFQVAAVESANGWLIMGAPSRTELMALCNEFKHVDRLAVRSIISLMKGYLRAQNARKGDLYNAVSHLNKELLSKQQQLALKNNELEQNLQELDLLYNITSRFLSTLDIKSILDSLLEGLALLDGYVLYLWSSRQKSFEIEASEGETGDIKDALRVEAQNVFYPRVVGCRALLPLRVGHQRLGVLVLFARPALFRGTRFQVLESVAANLSMAIRNARLHAKVEELALRDPLTSLLNRRGFFSSCERVLTDAFDKKRSVAVLMMDIDHFKRINDTYGHDVGDDVLAETSGKLAQLLETADVLGRYGGEEFACLVSGSSLSEAMTLTEKLRQFVAENPILVGESEVLQVTMSFGVSFWFPEQNLKERPNIDKLLKRADEALYTAKNNGRNRVVIWSKHGGHPPPVSLGKKRLVPS